MDKEKRKHQENVSREIKEQYHQAVSRLSGGLRDDAYESLVRLREMKLMIDCLPVWPFDAAMVRSFFGVYLLPITGFLASPFLRDLLAWLVRRL